uniref:Uncharacterized protein n=1 Tax=Arundo donax TaxID=35708 RepID=A0A0A9H4I1_ARUDO
MVYINSVDVHSTHLKNFVEIFCPRSVEIFCLVRGGH